MRLITDLTRLLSTSPDFLEHPHTFRRWFLPLYQPPPYFFPKRTPFPPPRAPPFLQLKTRLAANLFSLIPLTAGTACLCPLFPFKPFRKFFFFHAEPPEASSIRWVSFLRIPLCALFPPSLLPSLPFPQWLSPPHKVVFFASFFFGLIQRRRPDCPRSFLFVLTNPFP